MAVATLSVVGLYCLTPFVAGFLNTTDRRGPKLFWVRHHEPLYTFGYYMAGHHHRDGKPREPYSQRSWFYGIEGDRMAVQSIGGNANVPPPP